MKKTDSDGQDLADLDRLIEEITVDAYGDDEKLWAFRQAFEDSLSVPCDGFVIGEPVSKKVKKPNQKMQAWIDARKRHHLSHAQVQMARELGMNPAKLGKLDNHKQEPWKLPLSQFIEELYLDRFGKTAADTVMSIEERTRLEQKKKKTGRVAKQQRATETA